MASSAEERLKKTKVDYTKLITPAKSNFSSELSKNKKLKTYKTPTTGRVNSYTPLAAEQNLQAVKNQQYISQLGAGATESIIDQADAENANINIHNQNVDRKMRQEELARKAAEAEAKLAAAKHRLKSVGGSDGSAFSMDGISYGAVDSGSIAGMRYKDPRGNTGVISNEQARNISKALEIATKRGSSDYVKQIMIATMMAESGARNLKGGDRDSAGLFQQRPSQGWGSFSQVTDINYSTNKFLNALKPNVGKGGSGWMDAQLTQRSAYRNGSNYKVYWNFAGQVVAKQNNPIAASKASNTKLDKWINNNVGKYHDYDKAYGTQCVDLFRYYVQFLGRKQPSSMKLGGGARSLWQSPQNAAEMRSAGFKQVGRNSAGAKGDIAVFGGGLGSGYGHVGVVVRDNGNGTVQLMNSNSSTVGNGKPTNIITISKKHLLGYWRP